MFEHNKEYLCDVDLFGEHYKMTLTYLDHPSEKHETIWTGPGLYQPAYKMSHETTVLYYTKHDEFHVIEWKEKVAS